MTRRVTVGLLCFLAFGTAGANVSEADLVRSDFLVPGDGLLVTDTETGFVWLSPLYTRSQSYNDIVGGFDDLLTTRGFQFATAEEVRALINNNFNSPPPFPGTSAGFDSATDFFEVFGIGEDVYCNGTEPPGPCPRIQGWAVDPGTPDTLTGLGMITCCDGLGSVIDFGVPADEFYSNLRELQRGVWLRLKNTQPGSDVSVTPLINDDGSSISLVFDNVESAGNTSAMVNDNGPQPPSGFKLTNPPVYYEISTTATFSGNVRVCISWVEGQLANESKAQLFHYEDGQWVDITDPTSRDTSNNVVCGITTSFSLFTLLDVKYPFAGFFQPVDNSPVFNVVKAGAAVPVKFSLGDYYGLNIFAAGYPLVQLIQCPTGSALDQVEETVTAASNSLSYDTVTGRYTYVWKTNKAWANSCRELSLKFDDGEVYTARFTISR